MCLTTLQKLPPNGCIVAFKNHRVAWITLFLWNVQDFLKLKSKLNTQRLYCFTYFIINFWHYSWCNTARGIQVITLHCMFYRMWVCIMGSPTPRVSPFPNSCKAERCWWVWDPSTFLWELHHSLQLTRPQMDTHMTTITFGGNVWLHVVLNYTGPTLQKQLLHCLVNH